MLIFCEHAVVITLFISSMWYMCMLTLNWVYVPIHVLVCCHIFNTLHYIAMLIAPMVNNHLVSLKAISYISLFIKWLIKRLIKRLIKLYLYHLVLRVVACHNSHLEVNVCYLLILIIKWVIVIWGTLSTHDLLNGWKIFIFMKKTDIAFVCIDTCLYQCLYLATYIRSLHHKG